MTAGSMMPPGRSLTEEAGLGKPSLRDRLRAPYAERTDPHPLVRLGAIYRLSQQADRANDAELVGIKERLLACIEHLDAAGSVPEEIEAVEVSLHAAINLAYLEGFEGVRWMLRLARSAHPELHHLATTALRYCRRFPLTGVVVNALDLRNSDVPAELGGERLHALEAFLQHPEDEFLPDAEATDDGKRAIVEVLTRQLAALREFPRLPGRELGLGTLITRPWHGETAFRRTAFASIEGAGSVPQVVAYDTAVPFLLDQRPARTADRARGKEACRAMLAYDTGDDRLAHAVCAIPGAELSTEELDAEMTRLALGCDGVDVLVVAEVALDKPRPDYRLMSASGRHERRWFKPEERAIGECFLAHEANPYPLSTRTRVGESTLREVVRRFVERTDSDLAIEIGRGGNRHLMATRRGATFPWVGHLPEHPVYLVEQGPRGPWPAWLSGDPWRPEDRPRVLAEYVEHQPEAFGVVLDGNVGADGRARARVVRFRSPANTRFLQVPQVIEAGTVALWVTNERNELMTLLIHDQRVIDGCPACFGTVVRLCPVCAGGGTMTCPNCGGTGEAWCEECGGGGHIERVCEHCNETGRWEGTCPDCGGAGTRTLTCRVCGGLGQYADTGRTCVKCGGDKTFAVDCRTCSKTGTIGGTCRFCRGQIRWSLECRTCRGTGEVGCRECRRTGRVACAHCSGLRVAACECGGENRGTIGPVQVAPGA